MPENGAPLRAGARVAWRVPRVGCGGPSTRSDLSPAERREDLDFVATEFVQREQSFNTESREVFEARLAVVESGAATLSHDTFIAGIQWSVAATDNGHTEALAHEHHRRRLPVDLQWFTDGF